MELVSRNFIIKITGTCNLNCSYCYMYNMGDTSYLTKPKVMDKEIALATLKTIFTYAEKNKLEDIALILHGGEPLLAGKEWIKWLVEQANFLAPPNLKINYGLQTNGTLLDQEWFDLFKNYDITCGISIDGTPEAHDQYRVDHAGRGSYAKIRKNMDTLVAMGPDAPRWGVLVVANPEQSSREIYNHLVGLGVKQIDFLWPDYHHDLLPPWPKGALGKYFNELFDVWYDNTDNDSQAEIRWFNNAIRMLLSGKTRLDALGPQPITELVIETDGSIEPLDALRTCQDHMTRLGLNVMTHEIDDLYETELFQICLENQDLLPDQCHQCPVYEACGAGYLPHRWSKESGFGNTSIHCVDLYDTLHYIRKRIIEDLDTASITYQKPAN